ncbi:toxin-antitoxin system YwqK family antitoxin [Adhaeretor mobilis]|uniref:MORN repeat variant n=1 Tax=Adhaeretor mobilis TaxID=1930276 RepID=A0A517MYU0_9BACT|nr:hypothetical protein [Adhaeretor mobilis]QDS99977.1 MORN repeat variant [Adhaeretor mobilis]
MKASKFTQFKRVLAPLTLSAVLATPVAAQQAFSFVEAEPAAEPTLADTSPAEISFSPSTIEDDFENASAGGETETFIERYPDGKPHIEREVTLDPQGNYINHGQWKMLNHEGAVVAEGRYEMGQRVGVWSRWQDRKSSPAFSQSPYNRFKAPFLSQATFTNGQLDGEWLIFDSNQSKCSQISISNGQRHGMAVLWDASGKVIRETQYKQGVPVGDVIQLDQQTGQPKKVATYLDGRQIVSKNTNFARRGGKKTEAQYLAPRTVVTTPDSFWDMEFAKYENTGEPLRHGKSRAWHANGQIQLEGQYEHDKRTGHFTYWHPNGQKAAEGTFRNDVNEGTWVWWHENGQKAAIGHYDGGSLIGQWRWWKEDGKLAKQKTYDTPQQVTSADELKDRVDVGALPSNDLRLVR